MPALRVFIILPITDYQNHVPLFTSGSIFEWIHYRRVMGQNNNILWYKHNALFWHMKLIFYEYPRIFSLYTPLNKFMLNLLEATDTVWSPKHVNCSELALATHTHTHAHAHAHAWVCMHAHSLTHSQILSVDQIACIEYRYVGLPDTKRAGSVVMQRTHIYCWSIWLWFFSGFSVVTEVNAW